MLHLFKTSAPLALLLLIACGANNDANIARAQACGALVDPAADDAPLVPNHACDGSTLEDLDTGDDVHACAAACKANAGCTCVSWHATGWSGSKRCRLEDDGGKGHTDRGNAAYSAMTMAARKIWATRVPLVRIFPSPTGQLPRARSTA